PDTRNNQLVQILNQITDRMLKPISRVVPRMGMMDFSPMIAIIILIALSRAIR
ncbi:MAG: YggT family protein, partial [Chloroflexi bacterium]|nr:YggT family protein [Chloroflexota bacterium]